MSAHTVFCPRCRAALGSARPLESERMVRCPQCGGHFPAVPPVRSAHEPWTESPPPSDVSNESPAPRRSSPYRMLLPAALLTALLSGGIVAALILLFLNRPAQAPDLLAGVPKPSETEARQNEPGPDGVKEKELQVAGLLARGWRAVSERRFGDAQKAFAAALKASPDDEDALKGLRESHAGMDREVKVVERGDGRLPAAEKQSLTPRAGPDGNGKQKQAEYQTHMDAARTAMSGERYADALAEYQAALRLLPDDNAALRGVQAAQGRLDDGRDRSKGKGAFGNWMDKARAALRAKRFDEAVASLRGALQLSPDDAEAKQLLKDAMRGQRTARAAYEELMGQAEAARSAGRFEEAARDYSEALKVRPGDEAATRGFRAAQGVVEDVATAQVAYQRFMNQGTLAIQNLQYGEALRSYAEALRLVPGDLAAAQGVRDARAGLDLLAQKQTQFDGLMKTGNAALRSRQFADAVRAFGDALGLLPDSTAAAASLRQARFSRAMSDGQAALNSRRFGDAVRAFEDALQEVPGDPSAAAGLRQARAQSRR